MYSIVSINAISGQTNICGFVNKQQIFITTYTYSNISASHDEIRLIQVIGPQLTD